MVISIHSPYEGRYIISYSCQVNPLFQSTLPMQGDTYPFRCYLCCLYFNPLSPQGEIPFATDSGKPINAKFQSTLPMRRDTGQPRFFCGYDAISIHSPRAGRYVIFPGKHYVTCEASHGQSRVLPIACPRAGSLLGGRTAFPPYSPCSASRCRLDCSSIPPLQAAGKFRVMC